MTETIEIYFEDLNQDAQKRYGKALCGSINTGVLTPIAEIIVDDYDEQCNDCPSKESCEYNQ